MSIRQSTKVVKVDMAHQLFVDDWLIEKMEGVKRVLHPVEKHPENPIMRPEFVWESSCLLLYGTVMRDEEDGLWKMWYCAQNHISTKGKESPMEIAGGTVCYAFSSDGIHWNKPNLGIIEYQGSRSNNIIFTNHASLGIRTAKVDGLSVIKDYTSPDRRKRFKALAWQRNKDRDWGKDITIDPIPEEHHYKTDPGPYPMGYYAVFSPDGIHWKEHLSDPVIPFISGVGDTMNLMHDPHHAKKYVAFVKLFRKKSHLSNRWTYDERARCRGYCESDDFIHWTKPAFLMGADELDPPDLQLYNNTGFFYQTLYLGFLQVYHLPVRQTLDIQLIYSRDGRQWKRSSVRDTIIPLGITGKDWDGANNSVASNPPIQVGDELWVYYSGRQNLHNQLPAVAGIGLGKLRLDGFISLDSGSSGGRITTIPLRLKNDALFINANADGGHIIVEILDGKGHPVKNYSATCCDRLEQDKIRHVVKWRGKWSLNPLKGKDIRLKFYLKNSSLYSFWTDAFI